MLGKSDYQLPGLRIGENMSMEFWVMHDSTWYTPMGVACKGTNDRQWKKLYKLKALLGWFCFVNVDFRCSVQLNTPTPTPRKMEDNTTGRNLVSQVPTYSKVIGICSSWRNLSQFPRWSHLYMPLPNRSVKPDCLSSKSSGCHHPSIWRSQVDFRKKSWIMLNQLDQPQLVASSSFPSCQTLAPCHDRCPSCAPEISQMAMEKIQFAKPLNIPLHSK